MAVLNIRRGAGLLVVVCVTLTACGGSDGQQTGSAPMRTTTISAEAARLQGIEITERTVGHVASRTQPALTSEIAGRVVAINVDAGARVEAGDVLLTLDAEPFELAAATASAEVARVDATLRNRRHELERHEQLLRDGAINQAAYDSIEADVQALEAQRDAAQANLRAAERNLALTVFRAPVDGALDERFVSVGDYITPGTTLFRLVGDDLLRVRLPFPETIAGRLRIGQPVRLQRPGAVADNDVVEGRITDLRPALAQGSRTLEALVDLRNPGGWVPGGSVAGVVVVEQRPSVVVPVRSIVQRPAGEVVYVVENGSVVARPVDVGWRGPDVAEILAGISAGELVAADGAAFLADGALVRVVDR
jgi:RND family efflux transporter MFP subunit